MSSKARSTSNELCLSASASAFSSELELSESGCDSDLDIGSGTDFDDEDYEPQKDLQLSLNRRLERVYQIGLQAGFYASANYSNKHRHDLQSPHQYHYNSFELGNHPEQSISTNEVHAQNSTQASKSSQHPPHPATFFAFVLAIVRIFALLLATIVTTVIKAISLFFLVAALLFVYVVHQRESDPFCNKLFTEFISNPFCSLFCGCRTS